MTTITEDNVADWMADHGHLGYGNKINELRSWREEIVAEGGRYGQFCEFTQAKLAKIDAMIADIQADAWERFQDWATD